MSYWGFDLTPLEIKGLSSKLNKYDGPMIIKVR